MKSCGAYGLCNSMNDVFEANNAVYSALVMKFAKEYVSGKLTIVDMDSLSKKTKTQIKEQGLLKVVQPYLKMTDKHFLAIMEGAE